MNQLFQLIRKSLILVTFSRATAFLLVFLLASTACGEENPEIINSTNAPGKTKGIHYLKYPKLWYASAEARTLADNIIRYQSAEGAWPKNTDFTIPTSPEIIASAMKEGFVNTIDNNATTVPMRFLALVIKANKKDAHTKTYRASFIRGIDYLLAAQYKNGGWPQFFPLRHGYYSHVTFNDDAMMNVMFLLRDVAQKKSLYIFVDESRRQKSAHAVELGLACILKTQIKQNGKLTAWVAQYDETTLTPAWARKFEPPSLSGQESVDIVRFLMGIEKPTNEQIAAIEGAITWFQEVKIEGLRYTKIVDKNGDKDAFVTADLKAEPLWARFYELNTNRPIFVGRDSVIHYTLAEIEQERRGNYGYYGTWPQHLLEIDYPKWRANIFGLNPPL